MKFNKKNIIIMVLIVFIAVIGFLAITYGKYIADSTWNYYLKAKGFYFTSDNLSEDGTNNINNLWDGNSVHFNINNYLNEELSTGYDIDYEVICTISGDAATYSECKLDGTESNTAIGTLSSTFACSNVTGDSVDVSSYDEETCELGGYIWKAQKATKDSYFDVSLTNESYELEDVIVNITVTSTSPYAKTLTGTFNLYKINTDSGSILLDYDAYDSYDRLIITNTYTTDKCLSLTWNSDDLYIGTSNYIESNTDENGYINNIKFALTSKNNISYTFYKNDFDATFDTSDFVIMETTGC